MCDSASGKMSTPLSDSLQFFKRTRSFRRSLTCLDHGSGTRYWLRKGRGDLRTPEDVQIPGQRALYGSVTDD